MSETTAAGDPGDDERRRKEEESARRAETFARATKGLDEAADYELPESYSVTPAGVWHLKPFGGGLAQVASAPLLITRVYVDPEGLESVEVTWRGRNGWVRQIVARSDVSSGKSLVAALADAGLPVIASDGAKAERWLSVFETCNRKVIPVEVLARWLGWQPDGTFVCGPDDGRKVNPAWPGQQSAPLAAHRPHGTFAGWRAAVKPLADFPVAVMVVAAAFAAPLLEPLGLTSFMLDIWGRSTRGKTTTAKVAASVWGEPTDIGTIYSWQTTLMPAEQRLNLVRGLPVVFDETQLVKDPTVVHKIIYALPMGRGQARGQGGGHRHASSLRFQTVLISTGERSALTFTREQGAAARALTLSRPPLPAGEGHGQIAAALTAGVEGNYGHAGPAFVRHLVGKLDRPEGRSELRAAHAAIGDELLAVLPPEADIARRRAPNLAALVLATRLAHEWGVMPAPAPSLESWAEVFQAEQETDNRAEMALDVVKGYLAGHPDALQGSRRAGSLPPRDGWLGRIVDADGLQAVAVLPERLKVILRDADYDLDAVRAMWKDLGYILTAVEGGRERDQQQHRMAGSGKARFFVFNPKYLNISDDDA